MSFTFFILGHSSYFFVTAGRSVDINLGHGFLFKLALVKNAGHFFGGGYRCVLIYDTGYQQDEHFSLFLAGGCMTEELADDGDVAQERYFGYGLGIFAVQKTADGQCRTGFQADGGSGLA